MCRVFLLIPVCYGMIRVFFNKSVCVCCNFAMSTQPIEPVCFLQASDLTGGVYLKIPDPTGLLQYLLVCLYVLI